MVAKDLTGAAKALIATLPDTVTNPRPSGDQIDELTEPGRYLPCAADCRMM